VSKDTCETKNPLHLSAQKYRNDFQANVSGVGQAKTRSPWGTLDQAGNVVEWTDTNTERVRHIRNWRRLHGGIANAQSYQLWTSAIGRLPERAPVNAHIYPWMGFRVGVIGNPGG
jgi:formylglycine-generating enzyme required for sulfatase activity